MPFLAFAVSQAPVAAPKPSSRSLINNEIVLTDSQKQEQYMARLFAKAKEDGDEEEVESKGHAPVQVSRTRMWGRGWRSGVGLT